MSYRFSTAGNSLGQRLQARFAYLTSAQFRQELRQLFAFRWNFSAITKSILFFIGTVLTPITFAGMLLGYMRAYLRTMRPKGELPRIERLPAIVVLSMALGALTIWFGLYAAYKIASLALGPLVSQTEFLIYLAVNLALCIAAYVCFRQWRNSHWNNQFERDKFASAGYATEEDLKEFIGPHGIYLGGPLTLPAAGHALLVAGTRGGKGVNHLIPIIMGKGAYKGSLVVLDPKGEVGAVTANYLRSKNKRVVCINPWDLLGQYIGGKTAYNPLDMLADKTSQHLIDDVAVVSEMLVPLKDNDKNAFFQNSARNILAGLILHLVVSSDKPTLKTLWEWCRLSGDSWDNLLADMYDSKDPVNGTAIKNAASELAKLQGNPETFASIYSTVLESTNFIKSQALQESLETEFDPYDLADGNTVVFVVFPFDKIKSHSRWLRLVVTTLMRAVVRKPNKRVAFLCDEIANLEYMSEIEVALAGYAGFGINMFLVYQDLAQVHAMFGTKWESIIANCIARIFYSVKDNFTCNYISEMMGDQTRTVYQKNFWGTIVKTETSQRRLATPDEVRRMSARQMIIFTGENPVAVYPKEPYYHMVQFYSQAGKPLYAPNPYHLTQTPAASQKQQTSVPPGKPASAK